VQDKAKSDEEADDCMDAGGRATHEAKADNTTSTEFKKKNILIN